MNDISRMADFITEEYKLEKVGIASYQLICARKEEVENNMKGKRVYRCDPDKNTECPATGCYRFNGGEYCKHTTERKYKMNIFKRIKEKIFNYHWER